MNWKSSDICFLILQFCNERDAATSHRLISKAFSRAFETKYVEQFAMEFLSACTTDALREQLAPFTKPILLALANSARPAWSPIFSTDAPLAENFLDPPEEFECMMAELFVCKLPEKIQQDLKRFCGIGQNEVIQVDVGCYGCGANGCGFEATSRIACDQKQRRVASCGWLDCLFREDYDDLRGEEPQAVRKAVVSWENEFLDFPDPWTALKCIQSAIGKDFDKKELFNTLYHSRFKARVTTKWGGHLNHTRMNFSFPDAGNLVADAMQNGCHFQFVNMASAPEVGLGYLVVEKRKEKGKKSKAEGVLGTGWTWSIDPRMCEETKGDQRLIEEVAGQFDVIEWEWEYSRLEGDGKGDGAKEGSSEEEGEEGSECSSEESEDSD